MIPDSAEAMLARLVEARVDYLIDEGGMPSLM
jgi:hypothetical protein